MPIAPSEGEQEVQWNRCPVENKERSCCLFVEKGAGKPPESLFVMYTNGF